MSAKPTYDQLLNEVETLRTSLAQTQAEVETFRSTEKSHQLLYQNLPIEVHIWQVIRDDKGIIITWVLVDANPTALKAWGKNLTDVVGKSTDEIFPISKPTQLFAPLVKRLFESSKPLNWQEYISDTGQTLQMVSFAYDDKFISTGFDIGDIKHNENALNEALLRQEELIEAGNVGLWDWNIETNKVTFSKEWKQQIGYQENEVNNEFEEWQKRVHPDDIENTLEIVKNSIATNNKNHQTEFRFKHKDGSYRWILAHGSVITDKDGNALRMLGSHVDITKQKALENIVNQHEKMSALGTLTAGIAHDFNNILAPIIGYAQLAKHIVESETKEYEFIDNIEQSANRAKALVEQLLQINRTSTMKQEIVELETIVNEVLTVLHASLPKNIEIQTEFGENLPTISADSSQMYQVILNLVTNAVQAMPNGGNLRLCISQLSNRQHNTSASKQTKDYLCLTIQDNGSGIAPELLDNVFEPFYTTKELASEKGTGLGLAIVASIVNSHHGYIELDSTPNIGTTFHICFPAQVKNITPVAESTASTLTAGSGSILLVDDEEMLSELGKTLLESLGYQVSAYTDSELALAEFSEHPDSYDLVITDYAMPKLDGRQLIDKMKAIRSNIPILVVTGYANLASFNLQNDIGCNGVLRKPYDIDKLSSEVKAIIN